MLCYVTSKFKMAAAAMNVAITTLSPILEICSTLRSQNCNNFGEDLWWRVVKWSMTKVMIFQIQQDGRLEFGITVVFQDCIKVSTFLTVMMKISWMVKKWTLTLQNSRCSCGREIWFCRDINSNIIRWRHNIITFKPIFQDWSNC